MHLSNQSLLVILLVGIVAGWLAGRIARGAGFGILGDLPSPGSPSSPWSPAWDSAPDATPRPP